jgi:ATP-binding cassette subfamily F protein uup
MKCAECHGDVHEAEVMADVILGKIGFSEPRMDEVAMRLSGGWKKRLSIACALASAGGTPDILFLDEPTNHLDVEGLDWLENFLLYGSQDLRARAVIFVTHDRVFLENCATRIVELSRAYPEGTLSVDGNYTEFRRRRSEFLQMQARAEESLANEVREDNRWLARGAKARRTKAKSRIEESGDRAQVLAGLSERNQVASGSSVGIDFNASGRKTRKLITAQLIAKSMGGRLLFKELDLDLAPGECVGLMGPNGSGKTTLLRTLLGELQPDAGVIKLADPKPRVVSMTQTRSEFPKGTLLSEAISPHGDKVRFRDVEMHVTAWSRRFLFRDEQLLQQVSMLSGGELARAHVARMMLEPADVLVLDEPTNDLDIPTLEVLEDAVEGFAGATLLVTHDRAMLERLACRIVVLGSPDGIPRTVASLTQALRVLSEFEALALKAANAKPSVVVAAPVTTIAGGVKPTAPMVITPTAPATSKKKFSYNEQREYDTMEATIHAADAKSIALEAAVNDPALSNDRAAYAKACQALGAAQNEVARLYERWAVLEAKKNS